MAIRNFSGRSLVSSLPIRARHPRSRPVTAIPLPPHTDVAVTTSYNKPAGVYPVAYCQPGTYAMINSDPTTWYFTPPTYLGVDQLIILVLNVGGSYLQQYVFVNDGSGYQEAAYAQDFGWNGSHQYTFPATAWHWIWESGGGTVETVLDY